MLAMEEKWQQQTSPATTAASLIPSLPLTLSAAASPLSSPTTAAAASGSRSARTKRRTDMASPRTPAAAYTDAHSARKASAAAAAAAATPLSPLPALPSTSTPFAHNMHSPPATARRTARGGGGAEGRTTQIFLSGTPSSPLPAALLPLAARLSTSRSHTPVQSPFFMEDPAPSHSSLSPSHAEAEARKLHSWFDREWREVEQRLRREHLQQHMQQLGRDEGMVPLSPRRKQSGADSDTSPSASTVDQHLLLSREQLVSHTFSQLLQHLSSSSRRLATLLEKLWRVRGQLFDQRMEHRASTLLHLAQQHSEATLSQLRTRWEAERQAHQTLRIQEGVEVSWLQSTLDAKDRLIQQLQDENDQDLLFSNQLVCQKEMSLLKQERVARLTLMDHQKLREECAFLNQEKNALEAALNKMEEERDQLQTQVSQLHEALEERLRAKQRVHVDTQYDPLDLRQPHLGAGGDTSRRNLEQSALYIQKLFRGFRTRQRLQVQGKLSRKHILHKIDVAQERQREMGTGAGGEGMLGAPPPSIPLPLRPLLSSSSHLTPLHFIRTLPRPSLLKWILHLYHLKGAQDALCLASDHPLSDLHHFLWEHYLIRHGSREAAEMELMDLMASIEKHVKAHPRIKLFSRLMHEQFDAGDATEQGQMGRGMVNRQASVQLTALQAAAAGRTPFSPVSSSASSTHPPLPLRLSLHSTGGRPLPSRVLDLVVGLYRSVQGGACSGPLEEVSPLGDGSLFVDVEDFVALIKALTPSWPRKVVESLVARVQNLPTHTRTSILALVGVDTKASSAANWRQLQTPHQPMPLQLTTPQSSSSSPPDPSPLDPNSALYLDFELALQLVVDSYLLEDRRLHELLVAMLRDAAANQGLTSEPDQRSLEQGEEMAVYSYPHFLDVLHSLHAAEELDEAQVLLAYEHALQLARHRSLSLHDLAWAARCHGVLPIQLHWEQVGVATKGPKLAAQMDVPLAATRLKRRQRAAKAAKAAKAVGTGEQQLPSDEEGEEEDAAADEDSLPPAAGNDSSLPQPPTTSSSSSSHTAAFEAAARRHEKELELLKSSHEQERLLMQQAHQQQIISTRRALEAEKQQAAWDYNQLFEQNQLQMQQIKADMQRQMQQLQEEMSKERERSKQQLLNAEQAVHVLRSKLSAKTDKYAKKKADLAALKQKLKQAPTQE